jgi:hypothetical protein
MYIAHAWLEQSVNFQVNPSCGGHVAAEKNNALQVNVP